MRSGHHTRSHWITGPAGAAPVLLLTLIASIGLLRGALTTTGVRTDAAPIADVRLNVNTASYAQLQLLPRIGPAMAQRIIDDRAENGPYADAEDIQRVRGIGPKTAERIAAAADF